MSIIKEAAERFVNVLTGTASDERNFRSVVGVLPENPCAEDILRARMFELSEEQDFLRSNSSDKVAPDILQAKEEELLRLARKQVAAFTDQS